MISMLYIEVPLGCVAHTLVIILSDVDLSLMRPISMIVSCVCCMLKALAGLVGGLSDISCEVCRPIWSGTTGGRPRNSGR